VIINDQEYWTIGDFPHKADGENARATMPPPDCLVAQIPGGEWVIVSTGGISAWRANREDILAHPAVIAAQIKAWGGNQQHILSPPAVEHNFCHRPELAKLVGKRMRFSATFERYGTKRAYRGPDLITVLLKNIIDDQGRIVSDHLWFNLTTGFKYCGMTQGDVVSFDARVTGYEKGYFGHRMVEDKPSGYDYKLSRPTKVFVEPKEDRHGATDSRP
jgi:hypothetical protein